MKPDTRDKNIKAARERRSLSNSRNSSGAGFSLGLLGDLPRYILWLLFLLAVSFWSFHLVIHWEGIELYPNCPLCNGTDLLEPFLLFSVLLYCVLTNPPLIFHCPDSLFTFIEHTMEISRGRAPPLIFSV